MDKIPLHISIADSTWRLDKVGNTDAKAERKSCSPFLPHPPTHSHVLMLARDTVGMTDMWNDSLAAQRV